MLFKKKKLAKQASWIVRIDDNMDCKYSVQNCVIIEKAFQQRKPEVPIVVNVRGAGWWVVGRRGWCSEIGIKDQAEAEAKLPFQTICTIDF